ncbi:MAG: helix-turn-helix transcriptional regulator [Acetobacteraceae bacterium]|nr:helix-turn-helix transcriptional regulator [Acetobacteraceae bacterium]
MLTVYRAVDRHVGSQMQIRRTLLGLSREQLGAKVGVSASDLEEYEAGRARVHPGILLDVADALQIPVSYFFADTGIYQ